MKSLERLRTTSDGMFGIKVLPKQLLQQIGNTLDKIMSFVGHFDRTIIMTRRDKLGQTVSLSISQTTNTWFNDGIEPELNAAQMRHMIPRIARNLAQCIDEERLIFEVARRFQGPLIRIDYEDIQDNKHSAFQDAIDFLAGGRAGDVTEENRYTSPEQPLGKLSSQLRSMFLDYVQGQSLA